MTVYARETQHMGLDKGFFAGVCQSVAVGLEKSKTRGVVSQRTNLAYEKIRPRRYSPSEAAERKFAVPDRWRSLMIVRILRTDDSDSRRQFGVRADLATTGSGSAQLRPPNVTTWGGSGGGQFAIQ